MKISSLLAAAAALALSGCAIFQRSPTWERVVDTRADYSGPADSDGKDGYINHLHAVLSHAGVEHKVVTYRFHLFNASREESVETATAVIYRDETTGQNPWWAMDEFRHVPVWLPSWSIEAQLGFFAQRKVEIVDVKEYGASPHPRTSVATRSSTSRFAQAPRKNRNVGITAVPSNAPAKAHEADPLTSTSLTSGSSADARSKNLFRSVHGTAFDPGSSVDRAKMSTLRRQLLSRNQTVGLRAE